jgi:hypothetical protein
MTEATQTARRSVVLLGSTGSIGTQAVDVISRSPERFRVTGLSAAGSDPDLLARQAVALGVQTVAVADADAAGAVFAALVRESAAAGLRQLGVEVLTGPDAATDLAGPGRSVSARRSRRCGRARRWRWPTRSRWSSAGGWCVRRSSAPTRWCRWTPSTRRSRSACVAARRPRCAGWC